MSGQALPESISPSPLLSRARYVRTAVQYIDEHVKDLPTVAETARVAGVSVRALNGAFHKYVGMSPRAYLIERRLQGVHRALTAGALSVSSAAHEWGYVNMGVFAAPIAADSGRTRRRRWRGGVGVDRVVVAD